MSEKKQPEQPLTLQQLNEIAVSVQDHLNTLALSLIIARDAYGMFLKHKKRIAMDAINMTIQGNMEVETAMPLIAEDLRLCMVEVEEQAAKSRQPEGYKNGKG